MALSLCMQLAIVASLVYASRRSLENALPVFCFFLVLMPLESQVPVPGLCDLTTMRFSIVTLLILYFVKGERNIREPLPLKNLMLLHVFWVAISTAYSLSFTTSAKQLLSQVVEYYLLYFLLVSIITNVDTIHRMLFASVMAMTLCCLFGIVEVYAHWSILHIFPADQWITYNGGVNPLFTEWGRGLRIRATFPHPILFGDALAMSIPITLYLLSIWEHQWRRTLLWIALPLLFWAIYKTSSRGPWLGTALCCVLLFIVNGNSVRKYLVIIGITSVLVLLARPGIWSTIDGLYVSSTDSATPVGASYLYRDALDQAVRNAVAKDTGRFLFGYGLGTFREIGLDINFLGRLHRWRTCDNNWAAFLYETGYGGLLLIGALLFKALWIAVRSYRSLPKPGNLLDGMLFVVLGGFYFLLLSVAGYSWGQQGYLAWILISIIVSHSRIAPESDFGEDSEALEDITPEKIYDLSAA